MNLISRYYVVGNKKRKCSRVLSGNSANKQGNISNILQKCYRCEITTRNIWNREENSITINVCEFPFHVWISIYYASSVTFFPRLLFLAFSCHSILDASWKKANRKFCIFFFWWFVIKLKLLASFYYHETRNSRILRCNSALFLNTGTKNGPKPDSLMKYGNKYRQLLLFKQNLYVSLVSSKVTA